MIPQNQYRARQTQLSPNLLSQRGDQPTFICSSFKIDILINSIFALSSQCVTQLLVTEAPGNRCKLRLGSLRGSLKQLADRGLVTPTQRFIFINFPQTNLAKRMINAEHTATDTCGSRE